MITFTPVVELDAPGAGNWQGAVMNSATKEWFLAEAVENDGADNAVFHHFAPEGTYLDSMTLKGGAHATAFGVSDTNVIWASHNQGGNDIVTFQYRPGKSISKADTQSMHVFTDALCQISFSPTRAWAAIRRVKSATEEYRRYAKADILANKDRPMGKVITVQRSDSRVVQGFGLVNEFCYVLTGASNKPSFVEKYSFNTGKLVGKFDVTKVGVNPGEEHLKREVEGIDGRYMGVKIGQGDTLGADAFIRKFRIFKTNF